MSDNKEIIQTLLEKKTKEPSQTQKKQYVDALSNLMIVEGYSDIVDEYLFRGYRFCRAKPLYDYIINSPDRTDALAIFFNGKNFKHADQNRARILLNLLALFLNERQYPDYRSLIEIIKKFPTAFKNKKGKVAGNADLNTCMLEDLNTTDLPPMSLLIDAGLSEKDAASFTDLFIKILDIYKPQTIDQEKKCALIRSWLRGDTADNSAAQETHLSATSPASNADDSQAVIEKLQESLRTKESELSRLQQSIQTKDRELKRSEELLRTLRYMIKSNNKELEEMKHRIDLLSDENAKITEDLSVSKKQCSDLERDLQSAVERARTAEIFSKDDVQKTKESLARLSSKLKIEYKDYMDAVDMEMNTDLGENMRIQLKNVFDILIKFGLDLH